MHIQPLASGSQGNCLLLVAAGRRLLVDQGLELADLEERMREVGHDPRAIDAVLMTHRHRDHRRGVAAFCRACRVPVYGTRRTLRSLSNELRRRLRPIEAGRPFALGGLDVLPVALSHDAPDTVGYRFDDGTHRFAMATDLGCAAGEIAEVFVHLDALLLEFNYDPDMLAHGPYPAQVRERVASDRGHLSNAQAAALLAQVQSPRLRRLWVAHVSRKNNRPDLALAAARAACRAEVMLAVQDAPSAALSLQDQRKLTTSGINAHARVGWSAQSAS